MGKTKKQSYKITKTGIILFLILSIILITLTFCFKTQIEEKLNSGTNALVIDYNGLVMHTINVGQAEAIMIKLPDNKNMLVDSGGNGTKGSKTPEELIDYLNNTYFASTTNKVIDYFVITHSDADHVGGASLIFESYQVNKVYRPNIFSTKVEADVNYVADYTKKEVTTEIWKNTVNSMYAEPDCEVIFSKAGINISGENYTIKFCSPTENYYSDVNAFSPLIEISFSGRKLLLTGDATYKSETTALENLSDVDILKVAHHGGNTGTGEDFLEIVKPEYAIFSCNSEGNNYGHPTQEVLNRVMNYVLDNNIYRTDLNGNILMSISSTGEIAFETDVENASFYIRAEYLLIFAEGVLFTICFCIKSKNKGEVKKKN